MMLSPEAEVCVGYIGTVEGMEGVEGMEEVEEVEACEGVGDGKHAALTLSFQTLCVSYTKASGG